MKKPNPNQEEEEEEEEEDRRTTKISNNSRKLAVPFLPLDFFSDLSTNRPADRLISTLSCL